MITCTKFRKVLVVIMAGLDLASPALMKKLVNKRNQARWDTIEMKHGYFWQDLKSFYQFHSLENHYVSHGWSKNRKLLIKIKETLQKKKKKKV